MNCSICNRDLGDKLVEAHHLIPKCRKGKDTVAIHKICHRKIHSVFTEKELEIYYHTVERLLEHEQIQKFVKWVAKKPPEYYDGSKETNTRRR